MDDSTHTSAELRTYLRHRRSGRTREKISEFEDFIKDVSVLFALRLSAEEYWSGSPRGSDFGFAEHRYQASTSRQAVPLEWSEVKSVILPESDRPRSTLITFVSTHCIEEVRYISSGLRRELSRERVSTPVGKVQQLDNYCMRWLMRQPGRDFAEKGGVRQRVMAVVRREQYDTLENRVFKDFLIRAENLADSYIEEIQERFSSHKVYLSVKRFRTACQAALELPEMDLISGLSVMPQPNYVLQQDNRYSKVWDAYCKIVRLSNLAEKLWGYRDVLKQKLKALGDESAWQVGHDGLTRFHSQVWVRPLNGKSEFTEYVCSHHALADESVMARRRMIARVSPVMDGIGVVDLSGDHSWGSALCIGGFHENARPRIHQVAYPLLDDEKGAHKIVGLTPEWEPTRIPLASIFPIINDVAVQDEKGDRLADAVSYANAYCARLFGEYRNCDRTLSELVVLSPDDWNAVTQEFVIRSFHMLERRRVHLLWRSVATVIGLDEYIQPHVSENDIVVVLDVRNDGKVLVTGLKYLKDAESDRLVPQRSVYLRNGKINEGRYGLLPCSDWGQVLLYPIVRDAKVICVAGRTPTSLHKFLHASCQFKPYVSSDSVNIGKASYGASRWIVISDGEFGWSQKAGSVSFCREHDTRTLYYDELEAMWVVGQFNEKVVRHDIVKANERFKGGATHEFELRRGLLAIGEGQHAVEFLFHIGELQETTRLHSYKESFQDLLVKADVPLEGRVSVSPGQGIAITTVEAASVLKEPIVLDYLCNMELSKWSIKKLEEEMRRSFPPTCATVEAFSRSDYEGGLPGFSFAPVGKLAKIRSSVEQYLSGKVSLSAIPDDAFAKAQRKTYNDLRPGESKLHLLDRRNVFGNAVPNLRPYWLSEESESALLRKLLAAMPRNYDKCLRLLAWTYRGNNPDLVKCVRSIVRHYGEKKNSKSSVTAVEVSFLSNFLSEESLKDLEFDALKILFARLSRQLANGNDLRLFYNLMQFDAEMFNKFNFTLSTGGDIINYLLRDMRRFRNDDKPMNYKSCLRTFLYFLRLRETERYFLRPEEMYKYQKTVDFAQASRQASLYEMADRELSRHLTDESDDIRMLRLATRKFLNGQGTIEDVVNVAGGE